MCQILKKNNERRGKLSFLFIYFLFLLSLFYLLVFSLFFALQLYRTRNDTLPATTASTTNKRGRVVVSVQRNPSHGSARICSQSEVEGQVEED